jgi:hypothetical protein
MWGRGCSSHHQQQHLAITPQLQAPGQATYTQDMQQVASTWMTGPKFSLGLWSLGQSICCHPSWHQSRPPGPRGLFNTLPQKLPYPQTALGPFPGSQLQANGGMSPCRSHMTTSDSLQPPRHHELGSWGPTVI